MQQHPQPLASIQMHYGPRTERTDRQTQAYSAQAEQQYGAYSSYEDSGHVYASRPAPDYHSRPTGPSAAPVHFQYSGPDKYAIAGPSFAQQAFPDGQYQQWSQQPRTAPYYPETTLSSTSYSLAPYSEDDGPPAPPMALPRSYNGMNAAGPPMHQLAEWPSTRPCAQPQLWSLSSPQFPQHSPTPVEPNLHTPEDLLHQSAPAQAYPFPSLPSHQRSLTTPHSFAPTSYELQTSSDFDPALLSQQSVGYTLNVSTQVSLQPTYYANNPEPAYTPSAIYPAVPRIYSPQVPDGQQPRPSYSTQQAYPHTTKLTPHFAQLPLQDEIHNDFYRALPQVYSGESTYSPENGTLYTSGSGGRSQDEFDFACPVSEVPQASTSTLQTSLYAPDQSGSAQYGYQLPYPAHEVPQASTSTLPAPSPPIAAVPKSAPRAKVAKATTAKKGKTMQDEQLICCRCKSTIIGRLYLKGTADAIAIEWSVQYYCLGCADQVAPIGHPAVQAAKGRNTTTEKKRSKRTASGNESTVCLLCERIVGLGGLLHPEGDDEEGPKAAKPSSGVICLQCEQKYQKCTDCGGAGIWGAGKWRAKQMFDEPRKTCRLDHTRRQNLEDTELTAREISTLTEDEKQYLDSACKHIFINSMLSNLAIPEVMEVGNAIMSSWGDLINHAEGGWSRLSVFLLQPLDKSTGRLRFVCLRWVRPNPRKKSKANTPIAPAEIGPGHELAGFALAEYTLATQDVYVSLLAPWTSGDGYDPSTAALQLLFDTIEDWRVAENEQAEVDDPDREPVPPILHAWTFLFMGRSDRLIRYMETRRGFSPLDKYLARFPSTPLSLFPPIRPVMVPPAMQKEWITLVKSLGPEATLQSATSVLKPISKKKASR